jgi:hypothetical protein
LESSRRALSNHISHSFIQSLDRRQIETTTIHSLTHILFTVLLFGPSAPTLYKNFDRITIENPETDPDPNSSNEPAIIAENHLQKDRKRLRNDPRKKYNVQKFTKQTSSKALVHFEKKKQCIPNNGNIYFALLSIEAAISFKLLICYIYFRNYTKRQGQNNGITGSRRFASNTKT